MLALLLLADLFVDGSALNCAAADGSAAAPFCTIAEALAVIPSGDTIHIAPGTYVETLSTDRSVTLLGTGGAGVTILDAAGMGIAIESVLPGTLIVDGLTVTGGVGARAGGIAARGPSILRNSTVAGNESSASYSGAAWNTYFAPGIATGCTFRANRTTETHYAAGAISSLFGTLAIERSTIEGNFASGPRGAALLACSTDVVVRNTTISGNEGTGFDFYEYIAGSGLYSADVLGCTITGNDNGVTMRGLAVYDDDLRLRNSIVAANSGGGDIRGPMESLGHNLVGDGTGAIGLVDGVMGDIVGTTAQPIDPLLEPLASNGGITRTHRPMSTSPAIDAADPIVFEPTDQRGVPRPLIGLADIGAHELRTGTLDGMCQVAANSTGEAARLVASGSDVAATNDMTATMLSLPRGTFGYFLTSTQRGFTANPNGSQGNLCLAGAIGRFVGPGQVMSSTDEGRITLVLDLTTHATPTGLVSVQAGDTWYLQGWFRDAALGVATSNFSESGAVTFL